MPFSLPLFLAIHLLEPADMTLSDRLGAGLVLKIEDESYLISLLTIDLYALHS